MAMQRRQFCIGAAAGGLALGAGAAHAAGEVDYMQIVFSDPKTPDMEAEFSHWYETQHIWDMFEAPGMTRIERFAVMRAATPSSTLPHHATLYSLRLKPEDVEPAMTNPTQRKAKGLNPDTPTFNHEASRSIIYKAAGPLLTAGPNTAAAKVSPDGGTLHTYAMIALINPINPPEDASYDAAHMQEVMGSAGMTWARLYSLYRPLTKGYDAPTHLAVWEFQSGDIDASLADLAARRTDGRIKATKRWAPDHLQVYYCKQLSAHEQPRA